MARDVRIESALEITHRKLDEDEETREDNIFGGRLLAETALTASDKFFTKLLQSKPDALGRALTDWQQLLDEVLSEYRWERELLKHDLIIGEFRPRTFFSVLPEPHMWTSIESLPTELPKETEARLLRIPPRSSGQVGRMKLSVLMPICNGYRRTFRTLVCVGLDIRGSEKMKTYQVIFHVCINYTDDNSLYEVSRFANSMARAHGIGMRLYWLENPTAQGTQGSPGMMRTNALNLMLSEICEESQEDQFEHFLHFCDDDIFIPPGQQILETNIKQLEDDQRLKIICGTYTNDDYSGFNAISSVRKRREFVHYNGERTDQSDRLLTVYGVCMTTTLARLALVLPRRQDKDALYIPVLNNDGKQFGADPYIAVHANKEVLQEFDVKCRAQGRENEGRVRTELANQALYNSPAYARRARCIGHPEETNVIAFVKRYWRDLFWGERVIDVSQRMWEDYLRLRKRSFKPIESKIEQDKSFRYRLAHAWLTAIRDKVKEWKQHEALRPKWLKEPGEPESASPSLRQSINWESHKTQHQICKDIVQDQTVFREVAEAVLKGRFGRNVVQLITCREQSRELFFPEFCRLLIVRDWQTIKSDLVRNKYLFHLHRIAEESIAIAMQFQPPGVTSSVQEAVRLNSQRREDMKRRYRLDLAAVLREAFPAAFKSDAVVCQSNG